MLHSQTAPLNASLVCGTDDILCLCVTSGLAVQHLVLSRGRLVFPRHAVHVGASEGLSPLRDGVQVGEDPAATGPTTSSN